MRLSMLDRKLMRDLWLTKGQAISIGLVIAAGVAIYVLMLSTLESLELTRTVYYDRYRFADVFAAAKRAPLRLAEQIREIPGVAVAEPRVVVDVTVDLPGFSEPIVGRLVSLPADRRPALCDVFIQKGHYLDPSRSDEVLVSANFAAAHRLEPGDRLAAVINGRRKQLRIAGLALSPEYVYHIRPGELMPDDRRFGIIWMEHRALATAYRMEGGFNNILLKLRRDSSEPAVIEHVDRLLEPYGGFGAIPRRLQMSEWFLENEFVQLRSFGASIPLLFLGVAAFLLNVVLTRIVSVQREQIGAVKALGYSDRSIATHYLKWAIAIALLGSLIGLAGGIRLGRAMTDLYNQFFHFPILLYRLGPRVAIEAVGISLAAAILGALFAVRRALRLPPAEAMRPEAPPVYRKSIAERFGLRRVLSQPARIIVRSLERRPLRALISIVGISAATALLILGTFTEDAIGDFTEIQFNRAQRYDLMVTFVEPASPRARHEIQRMPGVLDLEPFRSVPVRLIHGHRWRDMAITGIPAHSRMNRIIDASSSVLDPPPEGLALSAILANSLGIRAGDPVRCLFDGRSTGAGHPLRTTQAYARRRRRGPQERRPRKLQRDVFGHDGHNAGHLHDLRGYDRARGGVQQCQDLAGRTSPGAGDFAGDRILPQRGLAHPAGRTVPHHRRRHPSRYVARTAHGDGHHQGHGVRSLPLPRGGLHAHTPARGGHYRRCSLALGDGRPKKTQPTRFDRVAQMSTWRGSFGDLSR
ncbi:MAG: ABC transporter permease [Acidobacteriota bacterium]